jgi:anhydro-N-acetylmuramic acid kinase
MTGWTVIGLMSGTSVDGIDAAVLETDGTRFVRTGVAGFYPYQPATCDAIWRAVGDPMAHMEDARSRQNLDRMIASDHAAAVDALRAKTATTIDLIGFHGQTIFHDPTRTDGAGRPHPFATIQLGDAAHLANLTGIDVVFDVRRADIEAGGQGAPLAPVYHRALFAALKTPLPAVLVNIGGVANITAFAGGDDLIGFDSGPGNALLDDYMRRHCGAACDKDGALASRGVVDQPLVDAWMAAPFFTRAWPKSLDRRAFHACLDAPALRALSPADAMASLTDFTARSIAHAVAQLPVTPRHIMLAGGGRHNDCLVAMLQNYLGPALALDHGYGEIMPDMIEAELMAYLAARHCAGLATSFPATTGCHMPVSGGRLVKPDQISASEPGT